jgi:uncharacterized FlaG/YvyC family protein
MDIDIPKNISSVKTQINYPHEKRSLKNVPVPHRNEEIAKNAEKMEQEARSPKTVRMNYDSDIDRVVITVFDSQSGEMVRQIPEADSITFMKKFQRMIKATTNTKV